MQIPFFRPCVSDNLMSRVNGAVARFDLSGGHGDAFYKLQDVLRGMYGYDYCILTNSGTSACRAAVAAAVQAYPGKCYIGVPQYSCSADLMPVREFRKQPIFSMTDAYGNPDFSTVFDDISARNYLAALMCPYIYGEPPEGMGTYGEWAKHFGFVLIADISQAVGIGKEHVVGDIALGSLRTEKFLGCGEGGFLMTNDEFLYDKALQFCTRGKVSDALPYTCTRYGDNLLMPGITAAVAVSQLDVLLDVIEDKRRARKFYLDSFDFKSRGTFVPSEMGLGWQTMWVNTRVLASDVIQVMRDHGVDCRPGFYPLYLSLMHQEGATPHYDFYNIDPVADIFWKHGVLLPTPYGLTDNDFSVIENIVRENF